METTGLVIGEENNIVSILVNRPSGCGGNCGSCSSSCDSDQIRLELENTVGAKKGDLVTLKSSSGQVYKYAAILYFIPLVSFIGGILFGIKRYERELLAFLLGLILLVLSLFIVKLVDGRLKGLNEELISIKEIIN